MLGEADDRGVRAGAERRQRRQFVVLGLLDVGIDRPAVRAALGMAELDVDPLDHVVGERVAELVRVDVRLGRGVAHEVGEQALDDPVLAHDMPARARCRSAVRIASLCAPRSTSPSASSRFSISPAEARETPSISATRDASVGEPDVCGVYSPIGNARK